MATVLVVEDNEDLRELYVEVLSEAGHAVQAPETTAEVLDALSREPPSVLVTDLSFDGFDTVAAALERREERARTALLVVSGARDVAERARALGAAAWFQKPIDLKALTAAVDRWSAG
jgi:DNA-binding response OmpR family regulator